MERKQFLKNVSLAALSFSLLESCTRRASTQTCAPTAEETDGPFPTHAPANYTMQDIVGDRVGTPLQICISLKNVNNKCAPLAAACVDIWHCDSKGDYSEYGGDHSAPPNRMNDKEPPPGPPPAGFHDPGGHYGPLPPGGMGGPPPGGGMQATDYTKKHFLRGRQITNPDGLAVFTSIYPGWYSSRATHIHLHIFDAKGTSLLITQIAFPEEITHEVYKNGVYATHGLPDTSNKEDNVFQDSVANELASVSGDLQNGYTLKHTVYVKA